MVSKWVSSPMKIDSPLLCDTFTILYHLKNPLHLTTLDSPTNMRTMEIGHMKMN